MSYLPCENPSCKSFGKPHPNCQCHQGMAQGGDVKHFCKTSQPHQMSCRYYAQGGDVDAPSDPDPAHTVSGYLAQHGLHGLINLKNDPDRYRNAVENGHRLLDRSTSALFSGKDMPVVDRSNAKKAIDDWMDKGGIDQDIEDAQYEHARPVEAFAKGGEVKSLHYDKLDPAQSTLLSAAKGRLSNYLNAQRPQKETPKLAFDTAPDTKEQMKHYGKARDMAAHPLGILDHINDGTIDAEHVKHFSTMYPELNNSLHKKLTEQIVKAQLSGKKPSYKVRQGLSTFMGTPMSGDMSPQNIMAAQATFQGKTPPQAPQGAAPKPKKSSSSLTKSDQSFLTSNQALTGRQQKQ